VHTLILNKVPFEIHSLWKAVFTNVLGLPGQRHVVDQVATPTWTHDFPCKQTRGPPSSPCITYLCYA